MDDLERIREFGRDYIPAVLISGPWFQRVFAVLSGLLLFWALALKKELTDGEAKSGTVT